MNPRLHDLFARHPFRHQIYVFFKFSFDEFLGEGWSLLVDMVPVQFFPGIIVYVVDHS